jgi:hypothetical protein
MSLLKIFGVTAVGGMGILVAGLLLSNTMKLGLDLLFGGLLTLFVVAGAIALVARSL